MKTKNTYNLKELKNGNIKIHIDTLPSALQHILYEYIKMNKHQK